jgi:hypothetical protein
MVSKKNFVFKFRNVDGIRYEVYFVKPNSAYYGDVHGLCDDPEEKNAKIYINPYLTQKSELNTIVHEMTHAFFWDKTEKEVYAFANAATAILYRQGWRRDDSKRNNEPPPPKKKKTNGQKRKSNKKPKK